MNEWIQIEKTLIRMELELRSFQFTYDHLWEAESLTNEIGWFTEAQEEGGTPLFQIAV